MTNTKEQFASWMNNVSRKNGASYSKETINNYIKALESYAQKLNGLEIEHKDLFEYDTLDSFNKVKNVIVSHHEYEQLNISYHRIFSSALQAYTSFLSNSNGAIQVSNYNLFKKWLSNYSQRTYRESTIKRYLVALDKAEERLSIQLDTNIWEIRNIEQFNLAFESIATAREYEFANKKYGNGDLSAALSAYKKFILDINSNNNHWWPELSEYNPGISKEKWLEILRETDIIGENALAMFAGLYNLSGAATCAQLAEIYNKPVSHYIMTAVHAAERVSKYTGCPVMQGEENSKWWPILFIGRNASSSDAGTYIWKIREELYDALTEYNILQHLPQKDIRTEFFNYIGSENDLNGYQKSYKLVFYKAMIDSMDSDGRARESDATAKFRRYYDDRASAGKITDKDVDPIIANISGSSDNAVRNVMIHNPFKVISDKGFVKKGTNAAGEDLLCFNEVLMTSLSDDDWAEIVRIVDAKLKLYYTQIDGVNGGEKEMTIKEQINAIESYIAAKGFNYDGNLVENFYLSLKSKPFVILAGTSGTGKTRLVSLFAKAINAKLQIVPVRPDWSDSSDLFGHIDLSGNFKPGAIIDFIHDASKSPDTPFILCLDEMNLARVEYYMSDILSVIETRKFDGSHKITSEKALVDENACRQNDGKNLYGEIKFPSNLYIVGTVNMDETTFPFSKKVLDRANTIEFSYVDLLSMPSFEKHTTTAQTLANDFLVSEYITLNDCDAADKEYIEGICTKLQRINTILEKANAHIGYRVRDEIVFYMLNNKKAELLEENVAFDNQIMQKILPRIQGSSESIKKMLDELLKLCESEKYDASTKKINFMIKRYEEDGFTSYWL